MKIRTFLLGAMAGLIVAGAGLTMLFVAGPTAARAVRSATDVVQELSTGPEAGSVTAQDAAEGPGAETEAEEMDPTGIVTGEGTSPAKDVVRMLEHRLAGAPVDAGPGVLVADVAEGSPAEAAGVVRGDILLAVDGQTIDTMADLWSAIEARGVGEEVTLTVLHGDEERTLIAAIDDGDAAAFGVRSCGAFGAGHGPLRVRRLRIDDAPARIAGIVEDGAAEAAGLQPGDTVVALDGTAVDNMSDLLDLLGDLQPGDEVTLKVERDNETLDVEVTLGAREDDPQRAFLGVELANIHSAVLHAMPDDFEWHGDGELPPALKEGLRMFPGPGWHRGPGGPGRLGGADVGAWRDLAEDGVLSGAIVAEVLEDGAAADAGLERGSLVLAVDGEQVSGADELVDRVAARSPGDALVLTVAPPGQSEAVDVTVTLGASDDDEAELGVSVGTLRIELDEDGGPGGLRMFRFDRDGDGSLMERFGEGFGERSAPVLPEADDA